jgi:hypothetical protein
MQRDLVSSIARGNRTSPQEAGSDAGAVANDLEVHPRVARRIQRHAEVTITDVYADVTDRRDP